MNVSVVLPTYNSAMFVLQTIESILNQSVQPYEVIALDDGSDDETVSLLERYSPRLKVHRQQNRGVASARHTLCSMATGDLIAFIDHDDLWHPDYLKTQCQTAAQYPDALGFFTGHINFNGYRDFNWPDVQDEEVIGDELISPLDFVRRYNACPGPFASMSFFCIRSDVLRRMLGGLFFQNISGADDFHLMNSLPLHGPIAYSHKVRVAYRIHEAAQSENLLKSIGLAVQALELLWAEYDTSCDELSAAFRIAFASKRRHYAKLLTGAHLEHEGRRQLVKALQIRAGSASALKTIGLLAQGAISTMLPAKRTQSLTRSAQRVTGPRRD